jgi:hypothetical protein
MTSCDDSGQGCCPDREDCISDHCDGRFEPGSEKADEIEQHLATCTRCAEALEDYKAISAAAKVLKCTDCSGLDVQQLKQTVNAGLRRVVFMRRLAWGGAAAAAVAAAAAAVVAVVLPPRRPAAPPIATEKAQPAEAVVAAPEKPAVDSGREALIQQIIAELKEKPRDLAVEAERDYVLRRLREAGLVVKGPDPTEWIKVEDEARISKRVLELRSLIREMERTRRGRGVLQVDDATR